MPPARPHRLTLADLINDDEDRKPVLHDEEEDDDVLEEIGHPAHFSRHRMGPTGLSRSPGHAYAHGHGQGQVLGPGLGRRTGSQGRHVAPGICDFCGCTETVMWRRPDMPDGSKARVCNACGLYWIEHGVRRDPTINSGRRPRRARVKRPPKGYPEDVEGATLLLALARPKESSPEEGPDEVDASSPSSSSRASHPSPPIAGPSSRPDNPPSSPFTLSPPRQDVTQEPQALRSFWRPVPPPISHPPGDVPFPQEASHGKPLASLSPSPLAPQAKRSMLDLPRPREEHSPTPRAYQPALVQTSPSAYSKAIFAPRRPPTSPYNT